MKSLVLLALTFALSAHAADTQNFLRDFSNLNEIQRAAGAFDLCRQIFAEWPKPSYQEEIQKLGSQWQTQGEGAYYALSTCQSMWITKYLDPVKAAAIKRTLNQAEIAFYVSSADVLRAYGHLREEIRLYGEAVPASAADQMPAPYEILMGMASSERQMSETLDQDVRAMTAQIAANVVQLGGAGVAIAQVFKGVSQAGVTVGKITGRVVKQALLFTALAWGTEELADLYISHEREADLTRTLTDLMAQAKKKPLPIWLDEFYRATERLGYFYSYNLVLSETSSRPMSRIQAACLPQVKAYFSGQKIDFASGFEAQSQCQDAAVAWLGAAQYLRKTFPERHEALAVAERLKARAKNAYWAQEEYETYLRSLPICRETVPSVIFLREFRCVDPVTGADVI
jgi:hypothetical protein